MGKSTGITRARRRGNGDGLPLGMGFLVGCDETFCNEMV